MIRLPLAAAGFVVLMASTGVAQTTAPFSVTVRPTLDPLPIGVCGAVEVRLLDAMGGRWPRNPAGALMSIADFDMTVASADPRAVGGHQIDEYHWYACGCQAGVAGAVATITASYPAARVPANARFPGVAFQTTTTFTLAPAKGSADPQGCLQSTTERTMNAPAIVGATPAAAAMVTAPVALPSQPTTGTRIPVVVTPPSAGPPPRNVAVTGSPAEAFVTWDKPFASPGPVSHVVERWKTADPTCCRATSPTLSAVGWSGWIDPLMWSGAWTYQVTAIYADGSRGSASASYTYPEPEMPQGFKALQVARDTVVLTWQPVPGASYYTVGGPPSNVAIRVDTTTTRLTRVGVPPGNATWQVAAMYQGRAAGSPQAGSPSATISLDVVNPRYRLVAEAIRVTAETVDKPLSEDGMYDEVYVASFAELLQRASATSGLTLLARQPVQLSAVHGDVSSSLPLERSQAGTASANGGIRANDIVSPVLATRTMTSLAGALFVLWEGDLLPGRHDLVLHPMIWEVDQPPTDLARDLTAACVQLLCGWYGYMTGPGGENSAFRPGPQAAMAGARIAIVEGDIAWLGGPDIVHLERHDKDRPIGLEVGSTAPNPEGLVGTWRDKMVILSSEKIEAALASGQNRIEVRFWDHWNIPNTAPSTVNYLNGDYTLVIRIERMP